MNANSSENFADLLNESTGGVEIRPGMLINARIVSVTPDFVIINTGLKSDALVSTSEFKGEEIAPGDDTTVMIEAIEDGFGETRVSREKARRLEAWKHYEKAFAAAETVTGLVLERVKGGFTVELKNLQAFLPGSLVDVRPIRDPSLIEGKEMDFKIIKMDKKRNNIVVSRRAVLEETVGSERQALLEKLKEGMEVEGVVKNITDYGAFVDLGGLDGLLHITDIAWRRVRHPSEVLKIGDEVKVVVLKFDRDKERVSLGMKQLSGDPWSGIEQRYPVGSRIHGRVTNLADYGCFVEIEEGIEGLVHMSEMDWTNKNIHPNKIVQIGDEVEVMILEIDEERRRISLGMKQCQPNPWEEFAKVHKKGEEITGKIKSITDFGIFIGLEGNIDGLVHASDISWKEPGEKVIRNYKKGEDVKAVILAIDPERERISLGIKQLEEDPKVIYLNEHPEGSVVSGKITHVNAKQAILQLGDQVKGVIRSHEIGAHAVEDVSSVLKVDEEVQAKVIGLDRKNNMVNLSIKALSETTEKPKTENKGSAKKKQNEVVSPTLADVWHDKTGSQEDENEEKTDK